MQRIKRNRAYIIELILSLIFIMLLIGVFINSGEGLNIDKFIFHNLVLNIRCDFLTTILKNITILADPEFLVVLSVILFIFMKGFKEKFCLVFNIGFVTLINQILKRIICRPRPDVVKLINQGGYSFPSGHAMASTAFYGYLIYLLWKSNFSKTYKYIGTVFLILLIFTICFSRVYLGVHYTSDVIAGICLSTIHLIIFTSILKKKVK